MTTSKIYGDAQRTLQDAYGNYALAPHESTDPTLTTLRYINIVTRCEQRNPPTAFLGGLLVDAPGLGKTLSMISLLAFSKHKLSAQGLADGSKNTTLLVVPKTRKSC